MQKTEGREKEWKRKEGKRQKKPMNEMETLWLKYFSNLARASATHAAHVVGRDASSRRTCGVSTAEFWTASRKVSEQANKDGDDKRSKALACNAPAAAAPESLRRERRGPQDPARDDASRITVTTTRVCGTDGVVDKESE